MLSCLAPQSYGVEYNKIKEVDLWEVYYTLTPKIREEIQDSTQSYTNLAKKYHLNIKTVKKWKKAQSVQDSKSG